MKNIVVCCDGTGNEYGQNNTNAKPAGKPIRLLAPNKEQPDHG